MQSRSPDEQYDSAAVGAIEMLKTGCTTAYDLFMEMPTPTEEGAEAVMRAYGDVGMRAVLAPAITDMAFYRTVPGLIDLLPDELRARVGRLTAAPAPALVEITDRMIRRWHGSASGRIRTAVAPSIPGQCSDELLEGCLRLSREHGVGIHTHLCETKTQAVHARRRWGRTVVEHLAELGMLGPDFVGAHAIWLTDDDVRRLGDAGVSVAHNAASNLRLGSGIAPVRELLDAGVNLALGTDGSATSDTLNMFDSMRMAALINRVRFPYGQDHWLDARAAWQMATTGSARALGIPDMGRIAPGQVADLVLLDRNSIFLTPLNDPLTALVFCEPGTEVRTVLVGGRVVLRDATVLTVDEVSIRRRAQDAADRLQRDNEGLRQFAASLAPYLSNACQAAYSEPF
jgi:guanine deaminase